MSSEAIWWAPRGFQNGTMKVDLDQIYKVYEKIKHRPPLYSNHQILAISCLD